MPCNRLGVLPNWNFTLDCEVGQKAKEVDTFIAEISLLLSSRYSNISDVFDSKMDDQVFEEKYSKMLELSIKLDLHTYIVYVAKLAAKDIGVLICLMKFLSLDFVLCLYYVSETLWLCHVYFWTECSFIFWTLLFSSLNGHGYWWMVGSQGIWNRKVELLPFWMFLENLLKTYFCSRFPLLQRFLNSLRIPVCSWRIAKVSKFIVDCWFF